MPFPVAASPHLAWFSTLRGTAEQRLAARPMAHFERSVRPHGMFKQVSLNRTMAGEQAPATSHASDGKE